jgi:biopolymer transport protein ExbB/TolQ
MLTRNKGILSLEFLVPNLGLIFAIFSIEVLYRTVILPRAEDHLIRRNLAIAQGLAGSEELMRRPVSLVIMDTEPKWEIIFTVWGVIVLGYKFIQVGKERKLLKHTFIPVQPGERIIPEDALDRYKELKSNIDREPQWSERLLPECLLAALHRFHSTHSVQDAATAVRERSELASDELDSSLGLVRYIAWAIPAIGFVGTVRGIGSGLEFAEQAVQGDISQVTSRLGLAFNSTFVGLIMCVFLMYLLHIVQSRQESFIIETQSYCRDRLIDVMKVPTKDQESKVYA